MPFLSRKISFSILSLLITSSYGCASAIRENLMSFQVGSVVTLNAYVVNTILGFRILKTVNAKDGHITVDGLEFATKPIATGQLRVELLTVGNDITALAAGSRMTQERLNLAAQAIEGKCLEYLAFRQVIGLERKDFPMIKLVILPPDIDLAEDSIQIKYSTAKLELKLYVSEPRLDENLMTWATRLVGTIAHELNHFRRFDEQDLFPNYVSDETAAYLIQTCVRWALLPDSNPEQLSGFEDAKEKAAEFRGKKLNEAALHFEKLSISLQGAILSQIITWQVLDEHPDLSRTQARALLTQKCKELAIKPINVLDARYYR